MNLRLKRIFRTLNIERMGFIIPLLVLFALASIPLSVSAIYVSDNASQSQVPQPSGYFLENKGQIEDDSVLYYARTPTGYMTLGTDRISTWTHTMERNDIIILHEETSLEIDCINEMEGIVNYFLGSRGTFTNIHGYREVIYQGLEGGIDLHITDPWHGALCNLVIDDDVDASIIESAALRNLFERRNEFYLTSLNEESQGYELLQSADEPFLSMFLGGGNNDDISAVARDDADNLYLTGYSSSSDYPLLNEYQTYQAGDDVIITKLDSSGSMIFSTYIGGSETIMETNPDDRGADIAVDSEGNVYVTGNTKSDDFPTVNALYGIEDNSTFRGDYQEFEGDVFVLKLNSSGNGIVFSTYIGGTNGEEGRAIAINADGDIYIGGRTSSVNFPLVNEFSAGTGTYQYDGFVLCLSSDGDQLLFSSYVGGSESDSVKDIAIDQSGNIAITGSTMGGLSLVSPLFSFYEEGDDAYFIKLNSSNEIQFSSYLGGSGDDYGQSVCFDSNGLMYITGKTDSPDFDLTNPIQDTYQNETDCFITVISEDGQSLILSSYLGGSRLDTGEHVVVDTSNQIFVTGKTSSTDFLDGTHGRDDIFVLKMNLTHILDSACIGGSEIDEVHGLIVDSYNNTYVCGRTESEDFPSTGQTSYSDGYDGFVFGLELDYTPIRGDSEPDPLLGGYIPVLTALTLSAVGIISIVSVQFVRRTRRDEYEIAMSMSSISDSSEMVSEPISAIEWNYPTDHPDGIPEPTPQPKWNYPTDHPDGVPEPTPEWNYPTDHPDGIREPRPEWNYPTDHPDKVPELRPEWNYPTDHPDGVPVPSSDPKWNYPTDHPDGLPERTPEWNYPTDHPDSAPDPTPRPKWNYPTDHPDGVPEPTPRPKWNYPTDHPDGVPEPTPEWNYPTDHPDGLTEPKPEWNYPTDHPDGIPELRPEWNYPTDHPDGVPVPSSDPKWNYPIDHPDGLPETTARPKWNYPTDHPDGIPESTIDPKKTRPKRKTPKSD